MRRGRRRTTTAQPGKQPRARTQGAAPLGRVIAVTSGKGGVGKTGIAVNLAVTLAERGNRVVLLDGDLGLGNVDIMVGLTPSHSLDHVLHESRPLSEVVVEGPAGVRIIPAGSGIGRLSQLGEEGQRALLDQVADLSDRPDYLVVDTGSGIGENVLFLASCAQEVLVVTTPEPTSVTDAYALMKILSRARGVRRFRLVVNMASDESAALEIYHRLSLVADRFLGVGIDLAGFIPPDRAVSEAICHRNGVLKAGRAARALERLADTVSGWKSGTSSRGGVQILGNHLAEQGDPIP
ncbi:MAG: MinD/ParA family protein [Nitrospirota bacterium]|nr:MinD/ParA family protein [Nitrospirota bacterium]